MASDLAGPSLGSPHEQTGNSHLTVGCLIYPRLDQIDLTGPFEVLSRLPGTTVHIIAKSRAPIRDVKGLVLAPEMSIEDAPRLDVLVVCGGLGQQDLMQDEEILSFVSRQDASDGYVLSVCTGALLCGAAGILRGRRTTTHSSAWDLLHFYGAIPVKSRVVADGKLVSTAGVTAGLDGALIVASMLHGKQTAQEIQLQIEYAPEPPFQSGTPDTAPPEVLQPLLAQYQSIQKAREAKARRYSQSVLPTAESSVAVE